MSLLTEMWQLRRQQWASRDELEAIQLAKLQRQVKRAWSHSEFYRKLYEDAGVTPESVRTLSDLQRLPVVAKSELLAAGSSVFCSDIRTNDCVWMGTSGSTGAPIRLPFTRQDKARRVLKELRALMANGYGLRDRMLILIAPEDIPKKTAAIQRLGILRREYLSIFADQADQIELINSRQPDVLYSYTSCLRLLSDKIRPGDIVAPKILMTAAELLNSDTRTVLTDKFGVEPTDFYGSMEFGWIAWQCPKRKGYHINTESVIVECLRNGVPARQGEEGELVMTNLESDAAPLIRYKVGDVGVLSEDRCECGRTLPLLSHISGRTADCIVTADGRKFSPYFVTCSVERVPEVKQFQIIQETKDLIRVRIVPSDKGVQAERVRKSVQEALGTQMEVCVEFADVLPPEPNGKYRVVQSMLSKTAVGTAPP